VQHGLGEVLHSVVGVDVEEHALLESADEVEVVFGRDPHLLHEFGQLFRLPAGVEGVGHIVEHEFTINYIDLLELGHYPLFPVHLSFIVVLVGGASGVILALVVVDVCSEHHFRFNPP